MKNGFDIVAFDVDKTLPWNVPHRRAASVVIFDRQTPGATWLLPWKYLACFLLRSFAP